MAESFQVARDSTIELDFTPLYRDLRTNGSSPAEARSLCRIRGVDPRIVDVHPRSTCWVGTPVSHRDVRSVDQARKLRSELRRLAEAGDWPLPTVTMGLVDLHVPPIQAEACLVSRHRRSGRRPNPQRSLRLRGGVHLSERAKRASGFRNGSREHRAVDDAAGI